MIVLSHFYNEEYLLPYWLKHHRKIFDHGILIDYGSTDNSVNIIRELCPTWDIIQTSNDSFDARKVDEEIVRLESDISGWRICLNTTEFILGNFECLKEINEDKDIFIPCCPMVDSPENVFKEPDPNLPLYKSRYHGISPFGSEDDFRIRLARRISNYSIDYPVGRHYWRWDGYPFIILWYGYSPFNESLLKRKTQIQDKIPDSDRAMGFGIHHITNEEEQKNKLIEYQNHKSFRSLKELIESYNFGLDDN
jgi:hypothetical protein